MTESIFSETPQVTTPSASSNPLENLVGEGKKFKTVEDLAKGKLEADAFIDQLKSELAELRQESTARARLEEIVDRLTSQQRNNEELEDEHPPSFESPGQPPQVSQSDIERFIDQRITRREQQQTANQNKATVITKLKDTFGSDYLTKLEARRQELGLEKSDLDSLAARSPSAFMALVVPSQAPASPSSPPRSQARSEGFISSGTPTAQPGTKAYYDALKKSDPTRYWSSSVQWQMHKDAIRAAKEGREF